MFRFYTWYGRTNDFTRTAWTLSKFLLWSAVILITRRCWVWLAVFNAHLDNNKFCDEIILFSDVFWLEDGVGKKQINSRSAKAPSPSMWWMSNTLSCRDSMIVADLMLLWPVGTVTHDEMYKCSGYNSRNFRDVSIPASSFSFSWLHEVDMVLYTVGY